MSFLFAVLGIFTFFPAPGQPGPAAADTTLYKPMPDSLRYGRLISERPERLPVLFDIGGQFVPADSLAPAIPDTVHIWEYDVLPGRVSVESDSTLRWLGYLNLADRFYREKGAQSYRQGTVGRLDGLEIHTYNTRDIELVMEGLNLNSPLNDAADWNRVAIHKIAEMSEKNYGAGYRADIQLRDHYLVEPRTYLNFDESKFNFRSLDFAFAQNFRKKTNVEFSFWDRRDGGGYSRQEVQGRQAVVKVYHQLSHTNLLKAGYINNAMDRQEPFGYSLTNPQLFNFNRFIETPMQGSANSNQTSSDVYVQLHQRPDTSKTVNRIIGLHLQTNKWGTSYTADTLATAFRNVELYGQQKFLMDKTSITGTGRIFLLNEAEKENLSKTGWAGFSAQVSASQEVGAFLQADVHSSYKWWSDSRQTSEISGRLKVNFGYQLKADIFGGVASRAADIQALYWNSGEFTGNEELGNTTSVFWGAQATKGLGRFFTAGVRGDIRETENAIFIGSENRFESINPFTTISATAWLALESRMFEGEISANWRQYQSEGEHPVNRFLHDQADKTTMKAALYWKNYVFNRAAFVKAGFLGHLYPAAYHAAEYFPELNRWQYGTQSYLNPSNHRLDAEVSARVRWFMVLLKWENLLDRVQQLGYFETVGYPMPERRFIFGIRVLFTN